MARILQPHHGPKGEEECAQRVNTPRASWGRMRRDGFVFIIRAGFAAAFGFDQLCVLVCFGRYMPSVILLLVSININSSEINNNNL